MVEYNIIIVNPEHHQRPKKKKTDIESGTKTLDQHWDLFYFC